MSNPWDNTVDITKERALELARNFVAGPWTSASLDDVNLSILGGGYSARLYTLELVNSSSPDEKGPRKILVRLLGGKLLDDPGMKPFIQSEAVQAVIMFTLGRLGLGPKLLGLFDGGRLEEFIPSRTLSSQDLLDPAMRRQFARKLARYHIAGQHFPIVKQERHWGIVETALTKYKNEDGEANWINYCQIGECDPSMVLDFDFEGELSWLRNVEHKVSKRKVWALVDMNKLNCLVREEPDQFGETLTLIDYEVSAYAGRAYDLSSHIHTWPMDITSPNWLSGQGVPDEDIRRQYCQDYLDQTEELKDQLEYEFDPTGIDSADQMLMEVDYYGLFNVVMFRAFLAQPKAENSPLLVPFVAKNFLNVAKYHADHYEKRKNEFKQKYNL